MADVPPPPPGFKLQDQPPPPPPGFKLDAQSTKTPVAGNPTTGPSAAKGIDWKPVIANWTDPWTEMGKQSKEAAQGLVGDFTTPVTAPGGKPARLRDYAARAGATAMHGLDYAFAPLTGAMTSIVGRPVEQVTGLPKRAVGDVASMLVPIGGNVKAAKVAMFRDNDAVQALRHLFAPTSVGEGSKQAERTIRRATGEGDIEAERAAAEMVKHAKTVGNLPVDQQRALVHYIETRSQGTKIPDPKLQGAADAISKVYDRYRTRVEQVLPKDKTPSFLQDYYAHLWQEKPSIVSDRMQAFRQGSGRSLKKRTIPTIEEGIQAGLTPRIENPIENTMAYTRNMSRFLATHDMQQELKSLGYAKWATPGKVPPGWRPLDGILSEKIGVSQPKVAGEAAQAFPLKLYAPPEVARVYNNFISKGLEQGDAGPLWSGARRFVNNMTMLKLGLSTFHFVTMANEGVISELARSYQALSRGKIGEAAKAAGGAIAAPVTGPYRGYKLGKELLGPKLPDAMSPTAKAFIRSGGRLRMDPFYNAHGSGSFVQAIKRGTFTKELKDAAARIYSGQALDKAKTILDLTGRTIQTAASPIFEYYVPAMKRGAFASRFGDWMKANPMASQREIDDFAIKLQDSIDNRFGELVQDNLFWHRQMKQMAQILLLSPTWNLGTIREIGGGLADVAPSLKGIAKGQGITDRTAYVAALATWVPLMNGIMTYLKTGDAPKGRDLMAYRTGGRDPSSGEPERGMIPGYQKDVYAFGYDFPHHIQQEAINKLNPGLSTAIGFAQNKDYRGLPVYRPHGTTIPEQKGDPTIFDYILEQTMPISIGQLSQGRKRGSNLSTAERVMSIRPAPSYVTSPKRAERIEGSQANRAWRARLKADRRMKAQQEQD